MMGERERLLEGLLDTTSPWPCFARRRARSSACFLRRTLCSATTFWSRQARSNCGLYPGQTMFLLRQYEQAGNFSSHCEPVSLAITRRGGEVTLILRLRHTAHPLLGLPSFTITILGRRLVVVSFAERHRDWRCRPRQECSANSSGIGLDSAYHVSNDHGVQVGNTLVMNPYSSASPPNRTIRALTSCPCQGNTDGVTTCPQSPTRAALASNELKN
jgi:hypothetical protein